jgi:Zn finger protein HypA/HybF involved in hydrogenase expression
LKVNEMPRCPECHSHNVREADGYPEYRDDGNAYDWREEWETHYCICEECGCEWTETYHTERTIEIEKHGKAKP